MRFLIAHNKLITVLCLLVFLTGTITISQTRDPQADEGHFANCAWEFAHHGRLAFPMLTEWVPSLDHVAYAMMPLYFMQLGVVSLVTGYEIRWLRLVSVAWGLVLVVSWYFILFGLTRDRLLTLLGVALIAVNYDVMDICAGRYDPMSAGLNCAALACYVHWRTRNFSKAVLLCNCCLAAGVVTHPYAIFGVVGFLIFFAMLDLRKASWKLLPLVLLPYVITLGAWGVYVAQDVTEFHRQFAAASEGRLTMLFRPIEAFTTELRDRYLVSFVGLRDNVPVYMRVKGLVLVAYAAGFIGCFATRAIRRDPAKMALALFGVAGALLLTFAEGHRWYVYFIHVIPLYAAVLAVWLRSLTDRGRALRNCALAAVALLCAFSMATVAYRVKRNDYASLYVPTLEFLSKNVKNHDLVVGAAQCATRLGFREHFLEDSSLGYRNGMIPDYIVLTRRANIEMRAFAGSSPAAGKYIQRVLDSSDLVFSRRDGATFYEVYRVRKGDVTKL